MTELSQELIDLQTRVAFQEDMLQQLNTVIATQDREIRALQEQLKPLVKRFDDFLYTQEQSSATITDERPPHY